MRLGLAIVRKAWFHLNFMWAVARNAVAPPGLERLLDVLASLLAVAFARQRFLGALLLAGLQVKRMPLDLFDDVFLLDLALKPAQRAL